MKNIFAVRLDDKHKFQMTNNKIQTSSKNQNPKLGLDIVIRNLFVIWCLCFDFYISMQSLGSQGEELAVLHYKNLGYRILERNFIFPKGKRMGELDLVVAKNNELVFVEVKTRTSQRFGNALEAVDLSKQRKLVLMVKLYLRLHPKLESHEYRIDVAVVDVNPVRSSTSNGVDNLPHPVIILSNAIEDLD